ncbi:hypothetical protein LUZ61_006848 [Rhynchospora tenuis]|uniref:Exocyst subunit Exo70 family protein n=1 Tax=Rhynchospora tenuis TaxID=198213 RepID=A0AAD5ZSH0_9POAL|nr:hypothetical protein LUZ61_006848 [Rhynchospora tenuis]
MAENGEEKLMATVQHIIKTLGRTDTMTEDILKVFSNYDGRFSIDKLNGKLDAANGSVGGGGGGSSEEQQRVPMTSFERTLRTLDRQISQVINQERLIWSESDAAEGFLEAVDDLIATIKDLESAPLGNNQNLLDRADDLLQKCMFRLEREFKSLIERPDDAAPAVPSRPTGFDSDESDEYEYDEDIEDARIPIARPVTDYDVVIDALPPGSVSDLHKIARRMVAAGFGRECAETYVVARKGFLEESVARLGLRYRTAEDVKSAPWDELELEIARWIPAFNMVFKILVPSERRLCDRLFDGLLPYGDMAFAGASRPPALQLLSFADAVAAASRSPERLFRVVDMYEAARDLLPELETIFSDEYSCALRNEVATVCSALGSSIKGIFMELENLIRRDPVRVAVPGGNLHPITRYVMNYLRAACGSRQTLEEVMEGGDFGAISVGPIDPDRPTSSLAIHIAWIMDVLQKNLEAKSELYREPALSCVFLMNNGKYILQKVKDSELGVLLGEEWSKQMNSKVRRWNREYHRVWAKIVSVLQINDGGVRPEKLRVFNNYLDENCKIQREWVIADEQMRIDLRMAIMDSVVPAYRTFLSRLRAISDTRDVYVKYTPEDVEACIGELFQGTEKR